MKYFKKNITVTKDDLDQLNHVNNVRYVQWVQDIAEEHWLNNTDKALQNEYFWVLVSHFITYKKEALLNDSLTIKTYVSKSEGLFSWRQVEFHNATSNILIATSETKWCLMRTASKRPTRITKEITAIFD